MDLFTGLLAFPLTPTDDEGRLNPNLLERFLERIVAAEADSIGLLGSTGGYAYLAPAERKRTIRTAIECVAGRAPLIVGVGALRTDTAEDLARDATAAGADGLLLAPVSYQPLTEEEVFGHFEAVAAAGDLPLCTYNNPGTTKFTFSPALIARLAGIPNVTALKMPLPANGDYAGELRRLQAVTPDGFAIGYSGDWGARDALLAGGACWYSVVAGPPPGACPGTYTRRAGRGRGRGGTHRPRLPPSVGALPRVRELPGGVHAGRGARPGAHPSAASDPSATGSLPRAPGGCPRASARGGRSSDRAVTSQMTRLVAQRAASISRASVATSSAAGSGRASGAPCPAQCAPKPCSPFSAAATCKAFPRS